MPRPLRQEQARWEDEIVAEVRKARETLFAAAGYDLDAFCRKLREQQQRSGRQVIAHPPRRAATKAAKRTPPVGSAKRPRSKQS